MSVLSMLKLGHVSMVDVFKVVCDDKRMFSVR